MQKFKLLNVIIFLVTCSIFSQNDDYIITNKNDTIYGGMKNGSKYFITNATNEKIKIDPYDIKGYYLEAGDIFHESVKSPYVNEGMIFMPFSIRGKIKYYSLGNTAYQHFLSGPNINNMYIDYIISKNNSDPFVSFTSANSKKKQHKAIRGLIRDDNELTKEFDSLKGNIKNIIYIIRKYNLRNKNDTNNQKKNRNNKYILKDTILEVKSCENNFFSVKDNSLKRKAGKFDQPHFNPYYQGGVKKELEKYFNNNSIKYAKKSDLEYIVKIGFMVNCYGEIGNVIQLSRGKRGLTDDYINRALKTANNMSNKWKPATFNGKNVDCFQILTFSIFKGELVMLTYE